MWARFGARLATDPDQVTHDADDLTSGFWAVVVTFEGALTAIKFRTVREAGPQLSPATGAWRGLRGPWRSSLSQAAYEDGVEDIRERVAAGTVYQVNLCRILSHDLPEDLQVAALGRLLDERHPAPYAGTIHAPDVGVEIACASPESLPTTTRTARHLSAHQGHGPHGRADAAQGLRGERHDRGLGAQ